MELKTDLMSSLRARISADATAPSEDGGATEFGWPALHARLAAAHAAAQALAQGRGGNQLRAGGFGNWVASGQAEVKPSQAVNLADLGDGKSAHCIDGAFAGETLAGDRGQ